MSLFFKQALGSSPEILAQREVVLIDVANDKIEAKDYKEEEDPQLYTSQRTGRGPLNADWIVTTNFHFKCG